MTKEKIARQNINWRIIDGGITATKITQIDYGSDKELNVTGFVDEVMEKIANEAPFEEAQDSQTIIEFVGPKRLPREIKVKIEQQPKEENKWNIRSFFKRK